MGFNTRERTGNDSNCSWNLEKKISEVKLQQQRNRNYNLGLTKFRQNLKEFANSVPGDQMRQQENRVKNQIADAISRLSSAGDYKLKEKIFQQTCLQMNLNPTIDLFSQHFNNILPRFMSTIRGHGEVAINALNKVWKKKFPWIHPPIPLLPAVLKKIREEQIEAKIIAPLWPGQIWYTELVNENAQSLMLGWSNEILEPGTSLIKKNLNLPPGKICCFLMDRRPGREEDSR
ncbi:MAG: hypothetical protein EZS28_052921, partial [Streblomastix strix]